MLHHQRQYAEPPKVTGLSPNEGPPGTKVTIRGENLGHTHDDLIGLYICGIDCLIYAEWKSHNKVVTRTGKVFETGDVIVVTRSGGRGSSTVQFRGYEDVITPTKESAIWIDEDEYFLSPSHATGTLARFGGATSPTIRSAFPLDPLLGSTMTGAPSSTGSFSDEHSRDAKEDEEEMHSIMSPLRRNKLNEEVIFECFPDSDLARMNEYGNVLSENFDPLWYMAEMHSSTKFSDLKRGLDNLKQRLDDETQTRRRMSVVSNQPFDEQKQRSISFLKPNVLAVVECLDALKTLHMALKKDKQDIFGNDLTIRIDESLRRADREAHAIFDSILAKKDLSDSTRNALNVLQRYRFLFNLPSCIERNIQKGDFDQVINDYSRAKSLFEDTQVGVFQKVFSEVESRIQKFKLTLQEKLNSQCISFGTWPGASTMTGQSTEQCLDVIGSTPGTGKAVEEIKRLVRQLVSLQSEGNPSWDSLVLIKNTLLQAMTKCRDRRLNALKVPNLVSSTAKTSVRPPFSESDSIDNGSDSGGDSSSSSMEAPQSIQFVEEVHLVFSHTYGDLVKLGVSYLNGDLSTKESDDQVRVHEAAFMREMVQLPVNYLAALMRSAILPSSLQKMPTYKQLIQQISEPITPWPQDITEGLVVWLPHCLRCVISSHKNIRNALSSVGLSDSVLTSGNTSLNTCHSSDSGEFNSVLKQLTFDMRVFSMTCLFNQSAEEIRSLHIKESWDLTTDDQIGSRTQLPLLFESKVVDVLQLVRESILNPGLNVTNGPSEQQVQSGVSGSASNSSDIFSQINVQGQIKQLAQVLLQSFVIALDKTATYSSSTHRSASPTLDLMRLDSTTSIKFRTPDEQLLVVICNSRFTYSHIIPRLLESFERFNYPDMTLVGKVTQAKYRDLESKVFQQYVDTKCAQIVQQIEPNMNIFGEPWYLTDCPPVEVSLYVKEICMSAIEIESQVFQIIPSLVHQVLIYVVDAACEEVARQVEAVFVQISDMSQLQLRVDLTALRYAFGLPASNERYTEQDRDIPSGVKFLSAIRSKLKKPQLIFQQNAAKLEGQHPNCLDHELLNRIIEKFRKTFAVQADCLNLDDYPRAGTITL